MAYIGKQPVVGNFVKLDAITTSATATYNLLNGGVAYFPQTANNCIVSLNGVIQSPTSAYTISGSTIVFSDALTSSDTIDFILVLGDVLAIGTPSDGTVSLAKLASGTTGLIAWQSVQTTGFTAVAGRGYPCNTTSAGFTVTLPASPSVGDEVILLDYAGTFDTNALAISPNGNKIEGGTKNLRLTGEREGVRLVYIDSTQGWLATSGINEGTDALDVVPYTVDFLVIAGGGAGGDGTPAGTGGVGGGGAGGYRNSFSTETSGGGGSSEASLTFVPATVYTITVGAGAPTNTSSGSRGATGSDSSISGSGITTITSSGGGGGGGANSPYTGGNGGSGGGSNSNFSAGTGTANQGFNGNIGTTAGLGGAGGGAGGAGIIASSPNAGVGGVGLASSITGSSTFRAGGGGGASISNSGTAGAGGNGGGGAGAQFPSTGAVAGTVNTGGGGGGGSAIDAIGNGAGGGSGVVILRMPTANYSGTSTGSPTVSTDGSDTILRFTASGSYTG